MANTSKPCKCTLGLLKLLREWMGARMLRPAWTFFSQRSDVLCSGFRRFNRKKTKKLFSWAFWVNWFWPRMLNNENAKMLLIVIMQKSKTKHLQLWQNRFDHKNPNSDFPAAISVLLTACQEFIPNAVLLQHVEEGLKVSLLLQLCLLSQLLGDCSAMQNLRKYVEVFLGWYSEACVWLSLEGFWDTTNPIFQTWEVRCVNFYMEKTDT